MKKNLQHFLISLSASGGYMHAYLISDGSQAVLERITSHMLSILGELGAETPMSSMVLATKLPRGTTRKIETYLCKANPEAAAKLKTVDDFHVSIFTTPDGPHSDWLMALH